MAFRQPQKPKNNFYIDSLTFGQDPRECKDALIYINIESTIYDYTIHGEVMLSQNDVTIPLDTLLGQTVQLSCVYDGNDGQAQFQLTGNYVVNKITDVSESKGMKSFIIGFCDASSLTNFKTFVEGEIIGTGPSLVSQWASMIGAGGSTGTHMGTNTYKMYAPKLLPFGLMRFIEKTSTNGQIAEGKIIRKIKDASLSFDSWPGMTKGQSSSQTHTLFYTQSGGQVQLRNIERYTLDKIYNTLDFAIMGGCGIEFHAIDLASGRILQVPITNDVTKIAALCGINIGPVNQYSGKSYVITKATGFQDFGIDQMYSALTQTNRSDKPIPDPPLNQHEVDVLVQAYGTRMIVESLCKMQHVSFELTHGMEIDIGDMVVVQSVSSGTPRDYVTIFNPNKQWYVDYVKHLITKTTCLTTIGAASASVTLDNLSSSVQGFINTGVH